MISGKIRINCDICPYTDVEEFSERLKYSDKEEAIMNCCCEKVGGKLLYYGTCDDAIQNAPPLLYRDKKAVRQKRERDKKHKEKLKRLYKEIGNEEILGIMWHPHQHPVYPVNKYGEYEKNEDDVAYYKRIYKSRGKNGGVESGKKRSNKTVRKYRGELSSGSEYKKLCNSCWWRI